MTNVESKGSAKDQFPETLHLTLEDESTLPFSNAKDLLNWLKGEQNTWSDHQDAF